MWGTITRVFEEACRRHGDQIAVIDGERSTTYTGLHEKVTGLANGLVGLAATPGLRVGVLAPNSTEFVVALYGVWKARGTMVQLPALAPTADLAFMLDTAEAAVLIYHESFDEKVAELRRTCPGLRQVIRIAEGEAPAPSGTLDFAEFIARTPPGQDHTSPGEPEDLAYVVFTSGTTGQPKGVLQSQASYAHYAITAGLEVADTRPAERFVHCAPLTHFSQQFLLPTFMRGGINIMLPKMDLDLFCATVHRHGATATALVPTLIYLLLDREDLDTAALSSLRTIVYAGSPMSPERLEQAVEVFGPVFAQTYAGTEPGFMTCLRKEEHAAALAGARERLGSAGRAFYHVELSLRDEDGNVVADGEIGEIWAKQEGRMVGYLDPELNAETIRDGWVRSGDLGYVDPDGYLYIVDRVKDMIVTGGFNVFPRQIEDILTEHPEVVQCAVIGVPDDTWGEAVKAIVVTTRGATVAAEELIALVKAAKGGVWAPKTVDFVEALPLNPAGKVDKKALRAPFWSGRGRQVA